MNSSVVSFMSHKNQNSESVESNMGPVVLHPRPRTQDNCQGQILGKGARGATLPPPRGLLTTGIPKNMQICMITFTPVQYIMLLPSQKPSSLYSLLKFDYVTSHSPRYAIP